MSCTFDNIKAAMLPVAKVSTPEWGGHVYVRSVSGEDYKKLRAMWSVEDVAKTDPALWLARTVAFGMCDEHGVRMCDDTEGAVASCLALSVKTVKRVAEAFLDHNALTDDAVEDAEKN